MSIRRICICGVQVPFARGGAEFLVESLRGALVERGYEVDVVTVPFHWSPSSQVLSHALAWRLLDLTESQSNPIDLVIGTKFPAYLARHPNKVTWLFHQFRQAYELYGTPFGELSDSTEDQWVRDAVRRMDNAGLPESRRIYTIARNVSDRLQRYNGLASTPLYPPPPLGARYGFGEYGDFVLSVSRLEAIKRVDLLLRAVAVSRSGLRCVITGRGPDAERLAALTAQLGLEKRVEFVGFVSDEELLELYARCRAVYYAPYDEDYGFVTLEALRSRKPLLTTSDSGGVLEFVRHGETGLVAPPEPAALAAELDRLAEDAALCRRLGETGEVEVRDISWEKIVDALLSAAA